MFVKLVVGTQNATQVRGSGWSVWGRRPFGEVLKQVAISRQGLPLAWRGLRPPNVWEVALLMGAGQLSETGAELRGQPWTSLISQPGHVSGLLETVAGCEAPRFT